MASLAGGTMTPHRRILLCTGLLALMATTVAARAHAANPPASEAAAAASRVRLCGTPIPSAAELAPVHAAMRARMDKFGVTRIGTTIPIAFHVVTSQGQGDVTDRQI